MKVLALEKERQEMEAEGQSMTEQLGHSADREKGLAWNFAVLLFSAVTCLSIVRSIGDGARPVPGSHHPASGGEGESGGGGLRRPLKTIAVSVFSCSFNLCGLKHAFNI